MRFNNVNSTSETTKIVPISIDRLPENIRKKLINQAENSVQDKNDGQGQYDLALLYFSCKDNMAKLKMGFESLKRAIDNQNQDAEQYMSDFLYGVDSFSQSVTVEKLIRLKMAANCQIQQAVDFVQYQAQNPYENLSLSFGLYLMGTDRLDRNIIYAFELIKNASTEQLKNSKFIQFYKTLFGLSMQGRYTFGGADLFVIMMNLNPLGLFRPDYIQLIHFFKNAVKSRLEVTRLVEQKVTEAESGDMLSGYLVGLLKREGASFDSLNRINKNILKQSVKYFIDNADKSLDRAYIAAYSYEHGIGVRENFEKAIEFYGYLANNGEQKATEKIKELQEMIEARRIARNKAIVKVIVFLIKMFLVLILLDILILNIYFVEPVERIIESIYMSVGEGILYISKLIAE